MPFKRQPKIAGCVTALLAGLAVSACGFDGVELNGKIFDAVGLNTSSVTKEPKMRDRAPLVVPPGLETLPAPTVAGTPPPDAIADVSDHDERKLLSADDKEKAHRAFCAKNYDAQRALVDEAVANVEGPLGPCRPSILSGAPSIFNQKAEAQPGQIDSQ